MVLAILRLTVGFGRESKQSVHQPDSLSVGVSGQNQINNPVGMYGYDAAGNLTAAPGSATYVYNAEGQMASTAGVTYTYDGSGKRVEKSGSKLYWYGMMSDALEDTNTSGTLTNDYIFFGGQRIARRDASGNIFTYLADHLGSSRKMMKIASGANSSTTAYDADFYPFGRENAFVSGTPIYKFTGKERDTESGLDNFGARYDSSSIGRFMSPDPKTLTVKQLVNPQKWNKYAYTINNPVRYFDPDGMEEIEVQLRAFIQAKTRPDPATRIFAGDNRGFSSAANASFRTSITVKIETDASKRPGNPIISVTQPGTAGQTRELDANGNVIKSATATSGLPTVTGSRDANGNPVLNFKQDTVNPLEPQSVTPGIRADLNVLITQDGSTGDVTGTVSGSPSFELNVGGQNIPLSSEAPTNIGFDAGLFQTILISTPLPAPPPQPPACGTDKDQPCQ